jgi:hypothetical protein
MKIYSLKKGITKGAVSALTVTAALVTFAGFSDLTIWELIEKYIKPLVGSATVGGLITMALNYIKVKFTV